MGVEEVDYMMEEAISQEDKTKTTAKVFNFPDRKSITDQIIGFAKEHCVTKGAYESLTSNSNPNNDISDWDKSFKVSHNPLDNQDITKGGAKYDEGKARFDLVPPLAENEIARVAEFGARKYEDRNWESGIRYGRLYAAARRHQNAFWSGETNAPDSKLHHLAHAIWNLMAILEYELSGKKVNNDVTFVLDDRSELSSILREVVETDDN